MKDYLIYHFKQNKLFEDPFAFFELNDNGDLKK